MLRSVGSEVWSLHDKYFLAKCTQESEESDLH